VVSLAWGDQPALICEHVDWARAAGFKVICAGKGTRYHPSYHKSTPDTLWDILDQYLQIKDRNSINPKMFNSFIDGTKSGIEMTAVCNATCCRRAMGSVSRRRRASSSPMSASRRATAARWRRRVSPR
jgi:predicted homoserine dehydrogenase-like protein